MSFAKARRAVSIGAILYTHAAALGQGAPQPLSVEVNVETATAHLSKGEGGTLRLYFTLKDVEPRALGVMLTDYGRLSMIRDELGEPVPQGKSEMFGLGGGAFVALPKDGSAIAPRARWREETREISIYGFPALPNKLTEVSIEFNALVIEETKFIDLPDSTPREGLDLIPGLHLDYVNFPKQVDEACFQVGISYADPAR